MVDNRKKCTIKKNEKFEEGRGKEGAHIHQCHGK
jgi:hypothetical protein